MLSVVIIIIIIIIITTTRSSGSFVDLSRSHYAAAAGIEAVAADPLEGKDAPDSGYTLPIITVNGHTPTISVTQPQVDMPPVATYRYIDPGAGQGLASLATGDTWAVKLNGAEPYSSMFVYWSFLSSIDIPDLEIKVLDATGDQVAISVDMSKKDFPYTLMARLGPGDTYTIEYENQDIDSALSRAFGARGTQERTWIYAKATSKGYLITSIADDTTLRGYVRQIPGPGPNSPPIVQTVVVESRQGP